MQTERIRELIEESITTERRTGLLRQAIINLAHANGRNVTELQVQKVINFLGEYVEHAPALMKRIEKAAAAADALCDVQPILDVTEDYFLDPDDAIPDRLGLVGLMDDAYLTHSLMQSISDLHKSQTGESLMALETHEDNAFVRRLIGEPFASILDDRVSATLASASMRKNITQMLIVLGQLNLSSGPDPVWGNVRTSEIIDARLGAMGLF